MSLRDDVVHYFPALSSGLSRAELDELLGALQPCELAAHEVLLKAGEASSRAYLLLRGTLEVVVDPSAQRVMGTLQPGSFAGEVSLLDSGPTTATVSAGEPALVLGLEREALDRLRKTSPRIAGALVRAMTIAVVGRLRAASDHLDGLRLGSLTPPPPTRRPSLIEALRVLCGGGVGGGT